MNRPKAILPSILVLFIAVSAAVSRNQENAVSNETRLTEIHGGVYLHLGEAPSDQIVRAIPGASLENGDQIITTENGMAYLVMEGESLIEIGPNSEFTVQNIQEDTFNFFLSAGKLLAKITSLYERKQRMNIHTPVAVAAVRGTELVVSHDTETEKSAVGVIDEGEVRVTSSDSEGEVILKPGNETEVSRGVPPLLPRRLEVLRDFRDRMRLIREKRDLAWRQWKSHTLEERSQLRERLRRQRVMKREALPLPRARPISPGKEIRPAKPSDRLPRNKEGLQQRKPPTPLRRGLPKREPQ